MSPFALPTDGLAHPSVQNYISQIVEPHGQIYLPINPSHQQPRKLHPTQRPVISIPPHRHSTQSQHDSCTREHSQKSIYQCLVGGRSWGSESKLGKSGVRRVEGVRVVEDDEGVEGQGGVRKIGGFDLRHYGGWWLLRWISVGLGSLCEEEIGPSCVMVGALYVHAQVADHVPCARGCEVRGRTVTEQVVTFARSSVDYFGTSVKLFWAVAKIAKRLTGNIGMHFDLVRP